MEMVTLQGNKGHTGLTHPFKFFFIRALWWVPECPNIKKLKRVG